MRLRYPFPPREFANPVPSRPVNPVREGRVYDVLAMFAEQLEHDADVNNIAAARVRRLLRGRKAPLLANPATKRRGKR
jgi:hypothetical protein